MVKRETFYCDVCSDGVLPKWKATFNLIWGGKTVFHEPRKEREKHACNSCMREHEDLPGLHLADDTEWTHVRAWCMDINEVEGILYFPPVEENNGDVTELDKQSNWEYRPRESFNEDVEKIAQFIEEEIV